jgi:hypothetical protein
VIPTPRCATGRFVFLVVALVVVLVVWQVGGWVIGPHNPSWGELRTQDARDELATSIYEDEVGDEVVEGEVISPESRANFVRSLSRDVKRACAREDESLRPRDEVVAELNAS